MKSALKSILVYTLIIYFVINLFNEGINLPENFTYLSLTLLILSLTVLIACPLLSFLTVKCKFPPFFLMSSLLLIGIFFVFKIFMPDFYIDTYTFQGLELGSMEIKSFEVVPLITIVATSLICALFCGIYRELDGD